MFRRRISNATISPTPATPPRRDWRSPPSCRSCAAICQRRSKACRTRSDGMPRHRLRPEERRQVIHGNDAGFRMLTEKITRDRGFRCASYTDKCLRRRIAVRMRAKNTSSTIEYASILDTDPREYDRLLRSLTVNVTKFFRNWETYSAIEKQVIPALWQRGEQELRVWSAGCASGEEPYSVGILMHKFAAESRTTAALKTLSILGTDIDAESLGAAERALYSDSALGDTPAALRQEDFPQVAGLPTMLPRGRPLVEVQAARLLTY